VQDRTDLQTAFGEPAMPTRRLALIIAFTALASIASAEDQKFPDITGVDIRLRADGTFDFFVTVSSPYDTPQRYADAFRVMDEGGTVFGERILLHDHQNEQPFTRELTGITIPAHVKRVIIEGRDQVSGYGGKRVEAGLPGR
jgi:hypothetical protein